MAKVETSVTELKINKLTKAQYDVIAPSDTELYFVKDEAIDYNDLVNIPDLAEVATSGSYNDLSDVPGQPNWELTDSTQPNYIANKPTLGTAASKDITDVPTANTTNLLTAGGAYTNLVSNVTSGSYANTIVVTKNGLDTPITINNVSNASTATTASKLGTTTVGGTTQPIYINNGTPTTIGYTIAKSVPADAKFTDTEYNVFAGATSSLDGAEGLVKAPLAGDQNKFLKGNGDWAELADVANSGSYNDLADKPSFNGINLDNTTAQSFFGTSDTAATTVQKEVSIPSITDLKAGQIIIVIPSVTSSVANSTLKLNNFAAYPMRYGTAAITTSTDSIVWNAGYPSVFLFNGSYWIFLGHGLDSNTTYSLNYTFDAGQYTAGTGTYAITRYSIVAQKPDMTWEKITATSANYSTGTTKAANPSGFILNQLRYYYTTTTYANGAKVASNYFYEKAASVDMRYSTNCSGTTDWAIGDYIYLVGTLGADGLFYLDTTQWWTKTLPTTNDGKLYIRLGLALAAAGYTMSFFADRPIFYHDGTKLCEYKVADNKQDVLVSGTNIKTINSTSLLGSGDLTIDSLPSQSGNADKFLTTDGTDASWATLATVATTGSYADLSNKPTINDLTTSVQQAALNSGATSTNISQISTNTNDIATINSKIPSQASTSNQLADKAFVNSSITSMAANYITANAQGDSFATKAALLAGPYYYRGTVYTPTNNDYTIVDEDETKDGATTRYIYDGTQWAFQYIINSTSFTQAQLDAMNSGITAALVSDYDTHIADTTIHVTSTEKNTWNSKQNAITGAASSVTTSNLTASRVLVSNASGKIGVHADVTVTELGYLDGVTSAIQTQLNAKQPTLVSGTNIKTINSQSLLGSGNLVISAVPSQTGHAGKYLTTNGTTASWAAIDTLPSQTGHTGEFLVTDGVEATWSAIATYDATNKRLVL